VIAARVGLADAPVEADYLLHHVRRAGVGSTMRSFFWLDPAERRLAHPV
jgi:hypothetical protein